MSLPEGYGFRPPTGADLDAIGAVLRADDPDDAGQVVLDADFVREEWNHDGFDPATDAWVVTDRAGGVVAYGNVKREEPHVIESWGVVHPEHRGLGIGSALLDRIEERASDLLVASPSGRFRHAINARDDAAASMLRDHGLGPVRHFWHMEIDLGRPIEPGLAPDGIRVGPVDPSGDLAAVHAVLDEAFADDWGYHPEPFERWSGGYTSSPSFDPTLWLLARDGAEPVAALTANVFGEQGWVAEVGVVPFHRGRGIATALLRRSFATFAERGLRRVLLNVDAENPTGATVLYERVGMRVVKRWDLWERSSSEIGPEP
jgi:mycothiol synthase